jgi:alpha-glucosidase
MLALPGGAYIYQGEELGLPEVEDLPDSVLRDPGCEQSGRTSRGRDGCRVPIPWNGDHLPFGFSPVGTSTPAWLPPPASWRTLTVERQSGAEESTLEGHRRALRVRRARTELGDGTLFWLDAPTGAFAFGRDPGFVCIVNVSADPWCHRPARLSSSGAAG